VNLTSLIWTVAGGAGARTSRFPKQVRLDPKLSQRLAARGAVQASVVFDAQQRAFVADMGGWIQAFARDGQQLWERQLEGAVSATPACDPETGRLFAGTHAGWVCALNCADGAVLWRGQLPSKTDPRILSDLLYLPAQKLVVTSSWGGAFHALDAGTGESQQTWDAGIYPQSGASADVRGNIYCLRAVHSLGVCFVRRSLRGEETVLHRQAESPRGAGRMSVAAAPVLDENLGRAWFIINGDREGTIHAWSIKDERLLWTRTVPRMLLSSPAVATDGALILADMNGLLRAWTPDGTPLFQYSTGADYLLGGAVCDADGQSFLGDTEGRLHRVTLSGKGKVFFEASRSIQARPAFDSSGNLYLSATDRNVYVFKNSAAPS
jgi:outer membrane protein assembly factor BamB